MSSLPRSALLLCALILPLTAALTGCGSAAPEGKPQPAAGACSYPSTGVRPARKVTPPPGKPAATKPVQVNLETNRGNIPVTLSADETPCTVNSFLSLARQGYFDKTPCHRLTTAGIYVLQCGDPTGTGRGGPGYSFDDELIKQDPRIEPCQQVQGPQGRTTMCTYPAGTVAMANAGPDSNGSQFFLVYQDSPLAPRYTVFGRMSASGLKTVQRIARAGVTGGASDGAPAKAVTVRTVQLPAS